MTATHSSKSRSFITSKFTITSILLVLVALAFLTAAGGQPAAAAASSLYYTFNSNGTLSEAGSMSESTSPYFWLNSGGLMPIREGLGSTIQGPLPASSPWRLLYAANNPLDTGNGYYPQNIFRLVTRSTWDSLRQEVSFNIAKLNLTDTPNRDGYSGILFFSHYRDGNNLYYSGVRQDGYAVIKKKQNGVYTTLATARVFPGSYDKWSNPNLIPQNHWMRMKSEITEVQGGVRITLYLDKTNSGTYTKLLSATDTHSPITGAAYAGIRTDYMDVQFDNYRLTAL